MKSNISYSISVPLLANQSSQTNYISTTKYNIITFLPYALIIQFKRYANIYFLVTAILQSIPLISPLNPFSAVAPLAFVLTLSIIRQGYQDYQRYKQDKKDNASQSTKLVNKDFKKIPWREIIPSDIIKVSSDEIFPADMIPIISSLHSGMIYIETSSLDGQKNLKPKNSIKQTQLIYNQNQTITSLQGSSIKCSEPNGHLYQYDGNIFIKSINTKIQLTHKNLLIRGSKLKNTQWIIGIVVYTGKNTKIMKNSNEGYTKISKIESNVNALILGILLFQLICCAASSIYCYVLCIGNRSFQNLVSNGTECTILALISFSSYFILNNTMIPISLIVSLEFVKVFQGHFMQKDEQMYSNVTERKLKCNSVSINQQLGQIQYILSDKTGTLTCNKMVFKQIAIGNEIYGDAQDPKYIKRQSVLTLRSMHIKSKKSQKQTPQVFDARGIQYELNKSHEKQGGEERVQNIINNKKRLIQEIFFIISTCHECLREKNSKYQGPSPDQVALVTAAKDIGFQYLATENKIMKVKYKQKIIEFQFIQVFQFDSDRKRMSVVVKHNGVYKLYTKGADATILPRLSKNQKYKQYLVQKINQMSKNGLRSLMYAFRILPPQLLENLPLSSDIENDLTLLGITGIQDKLQDFVKQTIASLRSGGIKFILLTGDKLQTAQNISRSCGLIEQSVILNQDDQNKLIQTYQTLKKHPNLSLVVDGSKVNIQVNKQILTKILLSSQTTVFCRVTPAQKANVVKMIKDANKRTLAVGDGANDVNMIFQAHVGVGIYGQQGIRAAQVSNYAIGEFCLLWKLLLHHGRLNYIRISQMILYFFYKNMVFTIPQFAYSFYCMGSGQSVYLSWAITLYNLAFTFFPVVIRAVFETDLYIDATKKNLTKIIPQNDNKQSLYKHYPKMYYIGQKNVIFTAKNFISWFVLGTLQGILCLIINVYGLVNVKSSSGYDSYETGFYFMGISLLTCVIIVVNVKLALNVQSWNWLLVIGFTVPSLGSYFLYVIVSNDWSLSIIQGQTTNLLSMPNFYFTSTLAILGMFALDFLLFSIKSTKQNLENYIKYRYIEGRSLSAQKIKELNSQVNNTYSSNYRRSTREGLEQQLIDAKSFNQNVNVLKQKQQDQI